MLFTNKQIFLAEAGLLLTAIIWGSAFVVVKNATQTIPISYIIAIRFLIAAILMSIAFFKRLKGITKKHITNGLMLGALVYLSFYLQTLGVKYTTAGNNAFLTAVYVVLVPFIYWFIKKQKPDRYNLFAALICIAGIGFISLNLNFTVNFGDLLSLLCGVAFAFQIVAVSIFTEKQDPILLCLLQAFFAGLFGLAGALSFETFPTEIDSGSVLGLLYLGIFSTTVAFGLQTVGQKYAPALKASLLMSLESVFGCLSGAIFLQELITAKILIGFLLVFVAVILCETKLSFLKVKKSQISKMVPIDFQEENTPKRR